MLTYFLNHTERYFLKTMFCGIFENFLVRLGWIL